MLTLDIELMERGVLLRYKTNTHERMESELLTLSNMIHKRDFIRGDRDRIAILVESIRLCLLILALIDQRLVRDNTSHVPAQSP